MKILKKLTGKIWRKTPQFIRAGVARATQDTFTASVGVVVVSTEGKILLLDHILRPASGWGIPGGFLTRGEYYFEAAEREIFEETGLKLENMELSQIRIVNRHIEFLLYANASGTARAKSFEIMGFGWFDENALPPEIHRSQREIISEVLSKKRK